jgi:thiol-disulfide isomerase/thioredoxin
VRRLLAVVVLVGLTASACERGRATITPDGDIIAGSPSKLGATLRSMRGEPVVVNYWATWCEPCKVEMPRIVDASEKYSGRVGFLGVNVEDDVQAAEEFVRRYKIPFRSVADPQGKIRRDEKVLGLPVTQFYDADGKLALVHQGEIKADELEEKIEEVLRLGA